MTTGMELAAICYSKSQNGRGVILLKKVTLMEEETLFIINIQNLPENDQYMVEEIRGQVLRKEEVGELN